MNFKQPIQKRLNSKGWSMYRLAKESGVSAGGLSDVMNGKSSFNLERLIKIAQALNVSVWRLVKEAENDVQQ